MNILLYVFSGCYTLMMTKNATNCSGFVDKVYVKFIRLHNGLYIDTIKNTHIRI